MPCSVGRKASGSDLYKYCTNRRSWRIKKALTSYLIRAFTFTASLFEETLVVVHLQLAFHLVHGVEGHADHDEDRSAAERLDERIAGEVEDDRRHHRDGGDEDAAGQRDAMQHVLDIGHRRRARTCAGWRPSPPD